jgi:hypothetical protein
MGIPGIGSLEFEAAWKVAYEANRKYTKAIVGDVQNDAITEILTALVALGWTPPSRNTLT